MSGDPNAEERNVCITGIDATNVPKKKKGTYLILGEPQALAVAKRLVEEKVAEV